MSSSSSLLSNHSSSSSKTMSRPSGPTSTSASSAVQVVLRLRPMNDMEKKEGTLPVISASTSNKSVTVIKGVGAKQARSQFSFDNVFTSFSTQQEVFQETLQPVIQDVLKGFETCVFAYGQTGTGKTHTMEGNLEDPDQYGVIPRSAQAIFDALHSPQYIETNVTCSYLEIYNEELSDLLVANTTVGTSSSTTTSTKLDIVHGGKKHGVHCRGLKEQSVSSAEDVLSLMQNAAQARHVGETRMNKQSSRSHCIFTMRVETKRILPDGNGSILESQGKLHLVDLAGSECAKTAELKDTSAAHQAAREQERRNINMSLLTLGRVISMLKEQSEVGGSGPGGGGGGGSNNKKSKSIIPYRDSKLTRILQEALGGRCKTVIIATISPSILNVQESLQTLHYAQTANGIKNKPAISNSYMSIGMSGGSGMSVELMASSSMGGVGGDTNGVSIERWQEMEIRMEHMQQEVEEARQALARNYMQQQGLEERADNAEKAKDVAELELGKAQKEIETLSNNLTEERTAKDQIIVQWKKTEDTLQKTMTILKATQQTEESLTSEALVLLQVLKDSVSDSNKLYGMLQMIREEDITRRCTTREFHKSISDLLDHTISKLDELSTKDKENREHVGEVLTKDHAQRMNDMEETRVELSNIVSLISETASAVSLSISNDMIPKIDTVAKSVQTGINETKSVVMSGETQLSTSCSEAFHQLQSFGKQLGDMEQTYISLKDESLSNMSKSILEVKTKMEDMLNVATMSMQEAQGRSFDTRAILNRLVHEWNAVGVSATTQVKEISAGQQQLLGGTYKLLESETKRHAAVDIELDGLQEFLNKDQEVQKSAFSDQYEKIHLQKSQLDRAQEGHESLCEQVMQTVMDGVKDLVAQQLKLIVTNHSTTTEKVLGFNNDILKLNDTLRGKSSTTFETVSSTNTKLQSHSKAMQETDVKILSTLHEGRNAFGAVDKVVGDFDTTNTRYEGEAKGAMSILESVHQHLGNTHDQLSLNGQVCMKQLETNVGTTASESLSLLGGAGSKAIKFARDDIAGSLKESISKIKEPREALIEHVSNSLYSIEETAGSGLVDVLAVAKKSMESVQATHENVTQNVADFTSTRLELHKSQCNENFNEAQSMMKLHEGVIQTLTSKCKENIVHSQEQTSTFGHNAIQMDSEVPDLPNKTVIDYSEELSSTPSEAEVLQGTDLPESMDIVNCGPVQSTSREQNTLPNDNSNKQSEDPGIPPKVLTESNRNAQSSLSFDKSSNGTSKVHRRKRNNETPSRIPKRGKRKL